LRSAAPLRSAATKATAEPSGSKSVVVA
jgi:hypothetical protein